MLLVGSAGCHETEEPVLHVLNFGSLPPWSQLPGSGEDDIHAAAPTGLLQLSGGLAEDGDGGLRIILADVREHEVPQHDGAGLLAYAQLPGRGFEVLLCTAVLPQRQVAGPGKPVELCGGRQIRRHVRGVRAGKLFFGVRQDLFAVVGFSEHLWVCCAEDQLWIEVDNASDPWLGLNLVVRPSDNMPCGRGLLIAVSLSNALHVHVGTHRTVVSASFATKS